MLLIIFIPFFNFSLILLFSRLVGKLGNIFFSFINFLLIICLVSKVWFVSYSLNTSITACLGVWFSCELVLVQWDFLFDSLSLSILCIVSLVSFFVHVYSFAYIKADAHFNRFLSYLSLFTFFIFLLVTSGNFIQLFIGWEGVGLCSYLLINFWYTRAQANKAAIKAILINKIGDISYLFGISVIFSIFKTFDFSLLQTLTPLVGKQNFNYFIVDLSNKYLPFLPIIKLSIFDVICFFLFVGVIGKSAQLGLHTWLPAAIEGPTPVSALIHAATIVTAGIFLIIRTSFLFEISSSVQSLVVVIGLLTSLFSAFTAIFLYDIKRIIAYSTCSQLGYIAIAAGLSQHTLSLFHLINHAFFKALLFLTAGAIIHTINNEQDIRKLSGLFLRIPYIYSLLLIGNIAIIGLPFLSGFYSKDLIIEVVYLKKPGLIYHHIPGKILDFGTDTLTEHYHFFSIFFFLILVATALTSIYSFRLFYFLFLRPGTIHKSKIALYKNYTQPKAIQFALGFLAIGSLFCGYFFFDYFHSTLDFFSTHFHLKTELIQKKRLYNSFVEFFYFTHAHFLYTWLKYKIPASHSFFESEYYEWYEKMLPFCLNIFSIFFGTILSTTIINSSAKHSLVLLSFTDYRYQRFILNKSGNFFKILLYIIYKKLNLSKLIYFFYYNYYFNEFFNFIVARNFEYYKSCFYSLDKGFLEIAGPQHLSFIYSKAIYYLTTFYKYGLARQLFFIYIILLGYFYFSEFYLF